MNLTDRIVRESLVRLLKEMHDSKEKKPSVDNINKYNKAADYFREKYGFDWVNLTEERQR